MSLRLILVALCGAGVAIFFVPAWNWRVCAVLFFAVLTGAALALLFSVRSEKPTSTSEGKTVPLLDHKRAGQVKRPAPAEILLQATMNGMREGVLVVDETLRVVASNSAARNIFDRMEGTLERRRLSELTRNPSVYAAFNSVLENTEQAAAEVEMRDGDRRIFDLHVVPLRLGDEGSTRGALGVFFDITRLEHLERVRQEFLSNVSHELRTPLTAILAFVETLEEGAIEDQQNNRRFLHIIRKNAVRMHNLIDDILELSAIEAGNVPVEPADVRLHSLVSDVATALASRADARRIKVYNEIPPGTLVFADARRLEQMLTNLIDNAIKFNREGGTVTISHEKGAREIISIKDTGDGISPEQAERIFERFYRIDRARSRELGGTGLGLAIVKHLARLHGGEVSVQSNVGEGSTFIIELPSGPQDSNGKSSNQPEQGV